MRDQRGENPWPTAKEIIAGTGVFVHAGGKANQI